MTQSTPAANVPADLRYTREHEWIRLDPDAGCARVGITAYAQDALGDIVFVSLPEVGTALAAGQPFGEVESTKSVSDVYSPVEGTVRARNEQLAQAPELVNSDPYGAGWLLEIEGVDPESLDKLLGAADYAALIAGL